MLISNQEGPVVTLTIDRPRILNTLNPELVSHLTESIRKWSARKEIRVIILTGSGDRAFVGGVDIRTFVGMTSDGGEKFITDLHRCFLAIRESEKIVIASINGYALGGGLELVASCDLRIASDRAVFGMPEVKVGLPSVIEAAYFPRLIGLGRAAEMVYTGDMIDAKEAERIGLVNQVVSHERLSEATRAMAEKILANGPTALVLQKKLIRHWIEMNFEASIEAGIKIFREAFKTQEPQEGAQAFLEKRKPNF